ncbi:MAG TPA: hydroxymethylglutaryl-CoA reductase, degradative, partial [Polyangiaceae bacterium]|nr:hydroxymethylglutaryl-CoA reductase, degradative [Polyangiaceae bacterium]
MPVHEARIPGFHKHSLTERHRILSENTSIPIDEITRTLHGGGIDPETADKIVENVVGTYALPFGLALNFLINGTPYIVPMVVEEPSVIAAASNAARIVREGGGFSATVDPSIMACQIQTYDVPNIPIAVERVLAAKRMLLEHAAKSVEPLVALGGGPTDLEVRVLAADMIVVHVYTDCLDAMGANTVNTIAEALGPEIARLTEGRLGLRILSNLCDRRLVRARCRIPAAAVAVSGQEQQTVDGIVNASRFAELDPYRAATHNKGIMNGIDPVVIATGNDWRAVEAGAHAYAARSGHYAPLAVWRKTQADEGTVLEGSLEMPLSLGIVGGTLRVHPAARLALKIMDISTAGQLAQVAACAGLASNLAALRALATEGIQRGHMSLHARSVALQAGAIDDEVQQVANRISEDRLITVEHAQTVLQELRK